MPNNSIQLAKLTIALEEVKAKIYSEILPMCAHLAPEDMAELSQTLEIAAVTIADHQRAWQLVSEKVKGGAK